jgi:SAM-dependent methyltransferase
MIVKCPICEELARSLGQNVFDDRYGYPGQFPVYECNGCGHVFLHLEKPIDLVALYTKYYPRKSYTISDYKPSPVDPNPLKQWFNGDKRAFALVPPNVRVLDIGCGFGEALGYHKARGCEVHGVEADGNVKAVSDHFGLNIKIGDFSEQNFEKNYFDFVTMDQVLEHHVNPIQSLQKIQEILKPGGKLVCTIPNVKGLGRRLYGQQWIHWHAPYHLHFFTKTSLEIAAQKTGFRIVKTFTLTSSEWLFYQKMHMAYGSQPTEPSVFWDSQRASKKPEKEQDMKASKIMAWHRKKINHIMTRIIDALGWGDNLFVVFEKNEMPHLGGN